MSYFAFVQDALLLLLYALTSLLALIGNGLVYRVNIRPRRSSSLYFQSSPHATLNTKRILLLNLALADTLSGLTILTQFVFCSKYFLGKFSFSSYMCLISKSMEILGYNASAMTICAIAFDRYRHVENPLQQYHRRKVRRALLFIWILSILFSTTCLVSMKVNTYFNSYQNLISCQILFPLTRKYPFNDYFFEIRSLCLIFLFYIVPLAINTSLCILTIRVIARRSIVGAQQFRTFEQSRTRSIRLLMTFAIVFALCHSPVHFIQIRDTFLSPLKIPSTHSQPANQCNNSTAYLLFYWLGISSCCHNSIIYSWFNRQYRTLVLNCYRSMIFCRREELEISS